MLKAEELSGNENDLYLEVKALSIGYHCCSSRLQLEQMDIPYENCMNNHVESLMLDQSGVDQNLETEMIQESA
ncbi:hypothetical protein YC2023_071549 [Brassica napus]